MNADDLMPKCRDATCTRILAPQQVKAGAVYCSTQCRERSRSRRKRAALAVALPLEIACHRCGAMFAPTNHRQIYCKDACRRAADNAGRQARKQTSRPPARTPKSRGWSAKDEWNTDTGHESRLSEQERIDLVVAEAQAAGTARQVQHYAGDDRAPVRSGSGIKCRRIG